MGDKIKMAIKEIMRKMWTIFMWLGMLSGSVMTWTFKIHKRRVVCLNQLLKMDSVPSSQIAMHCNRSLQGECKEMF
jgi:hypothetical protein